MGGGAVARNHPTGKIAPRRGNVLDVERTVTHERIICRTVLRGSWQAWVQSKDTLVRRPAASKVRLIVMTSVTGTEGDPQGLGRHWY